MSRLLLLAAIGSLCSVTMALPTSLEPPHEVAADAKIGADGPIFPYKPVYRYALNSLPEGAPCTKSAECMGKAMCSEHDALEMGQNEGPFAGPPTYHSGAMRCVGIDLR